MLANMLQCQWRLPGYVVQVLAKCKASQFAYPPPITQEVSAQVTKVPTAVLSTTARARVKARQKEAQKEAAQAAKEPAAGTKSGAHAFHCP